VEAHTAAHRFWDYRPGGARYDEAVGAATELSTAIRTVYQAIDREMGLLLNALPAESNVFVIALFGIRELYPTNALTEAFCRQLGYQVPLTGASPSLSPLGILRRAIGADVRARMSRLLPLCVRRRLQAASPRDDTDWPRTRAFCLPSLHTGFIRVNCRGREPQGVVQPGTDYRNLLDELEADLAELVDMRSGEPAVADVIRTAEVFDSGIPRSLPDLVVEWRSGNYLMERVQHPRADLVQARQYYNRGTHHTMTGFMAAAGSSIVARTSISKVSPLEFAPAFLSLLGESAGRQDPKTPLMGLIGSGQLHSPERDR
jgi:predicted AlkP superfamily phosphohydrolase/phosphomutase